MSSAPIIQCHFESLYCDGIISIFQVLPVIWRSAQDLCIHPFTGHPCFRSNQLNYRKNYFFFLCAILGFGKIGVDNWMLVSYYVGFYRFAWDHLLKKKKPKRKITNKGTFFILKFGLSLLFEKLFVFTRWRAKSTSW